MTKLIFVGLGTLFGFLLSRAGATTYDFYAGLFLFRDFQLMWIIGVAATIGAIGKFLLRRNQWTAPLTGEKLTFEGKPYTRTLIPGSLLMGAGWGLAGACPGTALAMLGEGKLGSLFTIGGVVFGTFLYGVRMHRMANKQAELVQ